MIVLNLACSKRHDFEGWFASAEEFSRQATEKLVSCPVCQDLSITRLPSPPHVKRSSVEVAQPQMNPQKFFAAMAELARNSENVGEQFPEDARKIHYQEAPARNIRGVASANEVKALIDEGIPVLPVLSPAKDEVH